MDLRSSRTDNYIRELANMQDVWPFDDLRIPPPYLDLSFVVTLKKKNVEGRLTLVFIIFSKN